MSEEAIIVSGAQLDSWYGSSDVVVSPVRDRLNDADEGAHHDEGDGRP